LHDRARWLGAGCAPPSLVRHSVAGHGL